MKTRKIYPLLSSIQFFCNNSYVPETAKETERQLLIGNKLLLMDSFHMGKVPFLKKSTFKKPMQILLNYPDQNNEDHFELWLDYGVSEEGQENSCYCFTYYVQREV